MTNYEPAPVAPGFRPTAIRKAGSRELKLSWSDGHESSYSFRFLRQNCPCAYCVDEWSGRPLLEREKVPQDLEGLKVGVVGQYALSIEFSDGHATGLYPFKMLRALCPCEACKGAPAEGKADKKFLDKQDLRTR